MPAATISLAESAISDLEEIRAWYELQGAPEVGVRLVRELITKIERLGSFSESIRTVPEFGLPHLREIIPPPFGSSIEWTEPRCE